MSYTLINRVLSVPVSVSDAKKQSRITSDAEDSVIQGYLSTAIEYCEGHIQGLIQQSTVKTYFDDDKAILSRPVRAINAIKYIDEDGNEQSITTDYTTVRKYDNGCEVTLTTLPISDEIWVEYVAGYGDYTVTSSELKVINSQSLSYPSPLNTAILLVCADLYKMREATTDFQKYTPPLSIYSFMSNFVNHR